MPLPTSGSLSLSSVQTEFGGSAPTALSEYYRGGSNVPSESSGIPTSGVIAFSDFRGASNVVSMTYEIIGAGGEGAGGFAGGTGSAGSASSFSGSGFSTVTAAGGAGGAGNGSGFGYFDGYWVVGEAGEASFYGSGGSGGQNSDSGNQTGGNPAPASSYGAGGGGGGSAPFASRNGGDGGKAGTRLTGTALVNPSSTITVTIGTANASNSYGGDGANGYAKFTVGGQTFTFTSSGTFTVPS